MRPKTVLAAVARLHSLLPVALAVILLAVVPRPTAADRSLAGQLLVATPQLSDPNFAKTVIFLLQNDASGALGLVINRPMGEVPLDRLLGSLETVPEGDSSGTLSGTPPEGDSGAQSPKGGDGTSKKGTANGAGVELLVYYGGPVEPYRGFTLHSRDVTLAHSVPVDKNTAFNVLAEPLQALAKGVAPKHMIFALGYAGWGPGQLEEEVARGDWYTIAPDPTILFSGKPQETWKRAIASYGVDL